MNTYKILISLVLASLIFSCSSDDDGEVTSTEELTCSEEVSFLQDGVETTFAISGLDQNARAVMQLKDPSPFDPQGVSRAFALRLQDGLTNFDVVLEINVPDATSCIPLGTYDANTLSGSEGLLSFTFISGFTSYFVGLGEGSGSLEITSCDFENKQISGNFTATLSMPFSYETMTITNGVFEDVCFVE